MGGRRGERGGREEMSRVCIKCLFPLSSPRPRSISVVMGTSSSVMKDGGLSCLTAKLSSVGSPLNCSTTRYLR